ncbi:protein MpAO [Marchantia polymorpha subsp. ruderalis]|nr:hypothetical protein MARPO_0013s0153 [Marchantia polymorpha]BBN18891.1 hypothetical protein Mp_8g06370 [Marchantia polymorpha subsp. ruderalis]|eukprot:PTQ45954.1 hypothetical protein MARPO_0013s0153 [Marchantia polymorpha]
MGKAVRSSVVFAINGRRVELTDVDPRTSVLNYIREETEFKGTKRGCGEGGCGSCVVLLSKYDSKSNKIEEYTINSCLAPICSVDGCAITTTEGLKNGKEPHAVHTRLAEFHASQCGFCTPGMAVSIYSCLKNSSKKSSMGAESTKPTVAEAQKAIAGNLCRCTGYRPILDVCKSFAADVDIEDLGVNTFWESSELAKESSLNLYQSEKDPEFPTFLKIQAGDYLEVKSVRAEEVTAWRSASTLSELFTMYEEETKGKNRDVNFVAGNTSSGVYKDFKPSVYIDINKIPELHSVVETDCTLEVGSAVSLSKLITIMDARGGPVYSELAKHLRKVANEHVRNRASVGGNLILAQKRGFASDVATILLGAGSQVTIATSRDSCIKDMEEFLAGVSPDTTILQCIRIPSWAQYSKDGKEKLFFKTYRSSPRKNGNAVSSVNAAFLGIFQTPEVDNGYTVGKVQQLRLAFGHLGAPHAMRAKRTEKYLLQKTVNPDVLKNAVKILREDILSSAKDDDLYTATYKASVAVSYLFQFFEPLLPSSNLTSSQVGTPCMNGGDTLSNGSKVHSRDVTGTKSKSEVHNKGDTCTNGNSEVHNKGDTDSNGNSEVHDKGDTGTNGAAMNGTNSDESAVRSFGRTSGNGIGIGEGFWGAQSFPHYDEFSPLSKPAAKDAAVLQASGEAVYTGDIPSPPGTLHAALVYSKKALAKVKALEASDALTSPGATSFFCAKDCIAENVSVVNNIAGLEFREPLFAEETVHFVGECLGVLVADTHEHAVLAAEKVKVDYDNSTLGPPILSVEDAAGMNSFKISPLAVMGTASVGDELIKGEYRMENIELFAGSQYYFYMETHTALAVPDEDDCITVYSSNHSPEVLHDTLSAALGIPMHNIRVITRRLGGSFGGKNTRSLIVATACALAAFKLKKPVRMTLDRNTDMVLSGGRHESKATYSVEFNKDGKITSLETNVLMNGGYPDDYRDLLGLLLTKAMKCYNWTSWRHVSKVCRTNLPARSMMRAPGEIQGNFFAESIVEHVATYLGLDRDKVREINMHTHESAKLFYGPSTTGKAELFTLPKIVQRTKDLSNFESRKLNVHSFNKRSMWVKRGISLTHVIYPNMQSAKVARVSLFKDGSVAVASGGTEMGQGLFTKVKQATAYGLSLLWGENATGKVDLSKIRIVENDSISLANAGTTNAGTTSEGTCEAVVNACKMLVKNLTPIYLKLKANGGESPRWEDVVKLAKGSRVVLTAEARNGEIGPATEYMACGACASEVEVDLLTGSVKVLQADLVYDCGKSLNPAVDIGQIEGSFVQGIGYYLTEQIKWDENGVLLTNGTWTYKPPTIDNIPQKFNVELLNSAVDSSRILSSKTAGEAPLVLSTSVHLAVREAIKSARADLQHLPPVPGHCGPENMKGSTDPLLIRNSVTSMENVKRLCGLYNVEQYLEKLSIESS